MSESPNTSVDKELFTVSLSLGDFDPVGLDIRIIIFLRRYQKHHSCVASDEETEP